jgi:hypothetical protein
MNSNTGTKQKEQTMAVKGQKWNNICWWNNKKELDYNPKHKINTYESILTWTHF